MQRPLNSSRMGSSRLLQNDFHAAVLPFAYAIGCWQKWIRFAEAARHNFIAWNATAQQLSRDRVSAAHRKTLIVLIRTGTVRMAIHFNADHFVTAGGSCLTDDPARAELYRSLRTHGEGKTRYEVERTGMNGRIDTIQATILAAKLPLLAGELAMLTSKVQVSLLAPGPVKSDIFRETPSAASKGFHDAMVEMLQDNGLTPDEFAPLVLDAVARGDYWIIPQPEALDDGFAARNACITSRQPPQFYLTGDDV